MKPNTSSLALAALAFSGAAWGAVISYPDFSSVAGLTLNGSAAQIGNVLRLTPEDFSRAGSAFNTTPITLASDTSFSTYFRFRISRPTIGGSDADGPGADGLTFVVQTVAANVGGIGGGIGYLGIPNSLGVEFDTWNNGAGWGDPNGNHVNFDYNGSFSTSGAVPVSPRLNDGDIWHAWVDYNGNTDLLELRLSLSDSRPATALLSQTVDLPAIFGSANVFAGFTSGTGAAVGNHDILSWEFRDDYSPIPEPATGAAVFGGVALAVAARLRRRPSEN